ncbi:immunogenic protein [Eubacterium sp. CAG:86]|nr:immunogenic protein [Eubacterium sp. CAG:86]
MDKLKAACPFYSEYIIPAYTYNGQTESVKTLGVKSVLLASDSLSKDTVKQITSLLFDNSKQLQYATSVDLNLNIRNAAEGITIPFHAGAAAYYSEHGIDVITE